MDEMYRDPRSVAQKRLDIASNVDLLVVGAGPAGLAAAIEARGHGLSVMLVDENPVAFETMVENIPLQFGNRMQETVRNRNAMMEAMLEASPDLERAFECDVDVRPGTACLGLYVNQQNLNWMPGALAALCDEETGTSLVAFSRAIVATGRRDMGLAFPGWERPGVVGASAAVALARRYRALEARRAVVLGTCAEALLDALALAEAGVEIAAILEQAPAPVGPADLVARIAAAGIAIRCGTVVGEAMGHAVRGVESVRLSSGETIACDLVVLGVGAVPVVDLLDAAGCETAFAPARGGFVPVVSSGCRTSLEPILVAGDCAGLSSAKSADPEIAAGEGRRAAAIAAFAIKGAADAGLGAPEAPDDIVEARSGEDATPFDLGAYRKAWVRASLVEAAGAPHVCQCEEVTAREIVEVRPPRYLGWPEADKKPLAELLGEGPPQPDQIKRLTRAGMGACQGRRCREQVQALLALQADLPLEAIRLANYRAPVRPIPLSMAAVAAGKEDPAFLANWDSWFGMPRQWIPYWETEEHYTVEGLAKVTAHVSE